MGGLAPRVDRLGTEGAFGVLTRARELERAGRDVIHLEIGEPDFDTPEHVKRAAEEALAAGLTGYGPPAGLPELREAAAAHLASTRGLAIDPDAVLVATGAKPFLFFGVLATCGPGDEAILPDTGFPIYRSAIEWAGATPVPLPLREAAGFAPDPDELEALLTPRTRLVILNSPHNPTGGVLAPAAVAAIAEILSERSDAWILSDEVYRSFLYAGEFASVAAHGDLLARTLLVDSCSKTWAMTGWRCGFAAVPEPLRDPLVRFFVNAFSCVPPFVQHGAIAALTGGTDSVERMVEEFAARRTLVAEGLDELPGVRCRPPGGAFYAFPNVAGVPLAADELAERLLTEAGVALLPGAGFGAEGADHLRLSFAASRAALAEALERMDAFVRALGAPAPA